MSEELLDQLLDDKDLTEYPAALVVLKDDGVYVKLRKWKKITPRLADKIVREIFAERSRLRRDTAKGTIQEED